MVEWRLVCRGIADNWIFDTNDKQLTLKTETQDVIYSICKVQKIESILNIKTV